MPKSTYLATLVADCIANAGSLSAVVPWISLHSADPGLTGASELSGNAYARVNASAAFGAAALGVASNNVAIDFPAATPAGWSAATHFGVFDAATAGNFLYGGKLGTWSADLLTWLLAEAAYKAGDGADPGAAPTFTAAPQTCVATGILRFPVGTLVINEG